MRDSIEMNYIYWCKYVEVQSVDNTHSRLGREINLQFNWFNLLDSFVNACVNIVCVFVISKEINYAKWIKKIKRLIIYNTVYNNSIIKIFSIEMFSYAIL